MWKVIIFMHVVLEGPYYNSRGWWQKIFNRKTYVNYSPLFTLPLITARTQVMEFKFLLIAFMVAIFLAQYEASSKTCPRWVKLNKSPVCFGARGDQFGRFSYHRNIFVSSFMIVHRSGKVSSDSRNYNYWGGTSGGLELGVLLTDQSNKLLAPQSSIVSKGGWYFRAEKRSAQASAHPYRRLKAGFSVCFVCCWSSEWNARGANVCSL